MSVHVPILAPLWAMATGHGGGVVLIMSNRDIGCLNVLQLMSDASVAWDLRRFDSIRASFNHKPVLIFGRCRTHHYLSIKVRLISI